VPPWRLDDPPWRDGVLTTHVKVQSVAADSGVIGCSLTTIICGISQDMQADGRLGRCFGNVLNRPVSEPPPRSRSRAPSITDPAKERSKSPWSVTTHGYRPMLRNGSCSVTSIHDVSGLRLGKWMGIVKIHYKGFTLATQRPTSVTPHQDIIIPSSSLHKEPSTYIVPSGPRTHLVCLSHLDSHFKNLTFFPQVDPRFHNGRASRQPV
jgi:hypothetical protein